MISLDTHTFKNNSRIRYHIKRANEVSIDQNTNADKYHVSILFFIFGLFLPKYVSVANPLSIVNVRKVEASILPSGLISFLDCISIREEREK